MMAAAARVAHESVATESEPTTAPTSVASSAVLSQARIARLREACAAAGIDGMYVRDTSSIAWLTAFDSVFDSEAAHLLLVTPDRAVLHTDSRYADACERAARGTGVQVNSERVSHAKFAARLMGESTACDEHATADTSAADATGAVAGTSAADAACVRPLGIEDSITLAEYRRLEAAFAEVATTNTPFRETSGMVVGLRAVKDAAEIVQLHAAQAITDAAFEHIIGFMRPGMTEREVQIELEDFMRRTGADDLAFPSIVACGANGASPHAIPGNTRLEAGQCVVMDFGAKLRGYCSDMTRTVFLGEPTSRMRAAYEAMRAANEAVETALKPGVTGIEMHELAERVLADAGFGGKMGHGLGHGVGLDIHEEPCLNSRNTEPLVVGNVVTIEPGIYLAGEFGMRLEDFGVITPDGFEVFTHSPHDMVVL